MTLQSQKKTTDDFVLLLEAEQQVPTGKHCRRALHIAIQPGDILQTLNR